VELLGEFGLRPGELVHLTWGSVDWNLGQGANRGALRVEEQGRTRMNKKQRSGDPQYPVEQATKAARKRHRPLHQICLM